MRFIRCMLLVSLASVTTISAQDLTPEQRLFALRVRTSELLDRVPDHTCLETVAVTSDPDLPGAKLVTGSFSVEVAVSAGKEIYGPAGHKPFSDQSLPRLVGAGFTTTGLYHSLAVGLMGTSTDAAKFIGMEDLKGEPAFRYDFDFSGQQTWTIQYGNESGIAGEKGSFWAGADDLMLRRISVEATTIPKNLLLRRLQVVVDYKPTAINNRKVLLPATASVDATEASGKRESNQISFTRCRAFSSASAISFDGRDE